MSRLFKQTLTRLNRQLNLENTAEMFEAKLTKPEMRVILVSFPKMSSMEMWWGRWDLNPGSPTPQAHREGLSLWYAGPCYTTAPLSDLL